MSESKNIYKNFILYAFTDGISKAIPFLVLPIVAYYISPNDFGIVTNFSVLGQILFSLVALSSHTSLAVNYYKFDDSERKSYIFNLLITSLFISIIFVVILFLFKKILYNYLQINFTWQLLALSWALFSTITQLFQTLLTLESRPKVFGLYQLAQSILSAGLTLLFVVTFLLGWKGRIESLVLSVSITGIAALILLVKEGKIEIEIKKKIVISTILFGLPLIPHTLSVWLKNGLDKIYITSSISLAENGLYSFAMNLSSVFSVLTIAFFSAFTPYLYKKLTTIEKLDNLSAQKEKLEIMKFTNIFILIYLIILAIGYFLLKFFILYLFKSDYSGSTQYLFYMLIAAGLQIFYYFFSSYLFFLQKTKLIGTITFTSALIQALIGYFIVHNFGVLGLLKSSIFFTAVTAIFIAFYSNKYYPMPWMIFYKSLALKIKKQIIK